MCIGEGPNPDLAQLEAKVCKHFLRLHVLIRVAGCLFFSPKQASAYELASRLVGSEMGLRDSVNHMSKIKDIGQWSEPKIFE